MSEPSAPDLGPRACRAKALELAVAAGGGAGAATIAELAKAYARFITSGAFEAGERDDG
ncbi:MAG TPA: hypothetical protein VF680_01335 [Allosphingosinicella sp.]|jgi:hypothetical protein